MPGSVAVLPAVCTVYAGPAGAVSDSSATRKSADMARAARKDSSMRSVRLQLSTACGSTVTPRPGPEAIWRSR